MNEWKTYKLTELCNTISETYKGHAKDIVLINTSDVLEGKCLNHTKEPNKNLKGQFKKTFRQHDILYSEIRPANKRFAYINFDATDYIASTKLMVLRHNDIIEPLYLYYVLQSQRVIDELQMLAESRSGTFPQITYSELSKIEVKLPDKNIQKRILDILSSIDNKIETNRLINDNLEQQAQALYKQWFVDFEFPNEEGNPYKSSGGKMVDSEQGTIPDEWGIGRLEDVGDIIGGGTPSKAVLDYYTKDGIAWITPKDLSITQTKFTSKGEIDITELGYSNSSTKIMPRGSVLFSSRAPIGYISIAKNEVCTNQGFKSVVPHNGHTAFIYYFLLTNTSNIESQASGSTFKEASGALMKALNIVIPNDSILDAFEKIISPIFDAQENLEEENLKLATLRDILLPKLMSGELSVDDVLVD